MLLLSTGGVLWGEMWVSDQHCYVSMIFLQTLRKIKKNKVTSDSSSREEDEVNGGRNAELELRGLEISRTTMAAN